MESGKLRSRRVDFGRVAVCVGFGRMGRVRAGFPVRVRRALLNPGFKVDVRLPGRFMVGLVGVVMPKKELV